MSVRIKFCGFTRAEDAALAASLGIDAIGVVHVPGSKRHVPLEVMPAIRAAVPANIDLVALFVNPDADTVQAVITALQPSLLQFHGDEADAFCAGFGLPFIKAMAMGGKAGDIRLRQKDYPSAQAFVLDGHAPGQLGGQGEAFTWTKLPALDKPIYLAGGLTPENVAEAIATVKPYAVDVSSGIESTPGKKDAKKMQEFFEVAKMAE
ncbi:MAG: phosphoribosylanthranilate isomerase [Arenimonas sp.]